MRRLLGSVLCPLLLLLAACGEDEAGSISDDPAPSPSTSEAGGPTPSQGDLAEQVDFELVEIITETAAGGDGDGEAALGTAFPLGDETAVTEFASQFSNDAMQTKLLDLFTSTEVPDGKALYAAVVAVSCDTPGAVTVALGDSGLVINARPVPSPRQECYAPMTSVAVVLVDAEAVS